MNIFYGKAVGVSRGKEWPLLKRPQGPIDNPPSVQNPQEGLSRSPQVTFQRGNQKKRSKRREGRREQEGQEDETSSVQAQAMWF